MERRRKRRIQDNGDVMLFLGPYGRNSRKGENRNGRSKEEMLAADDINNNTLAEAYGSAIDRREKMNRVRFDGSESARSSEIT
ncbi:hypothetical protein CDAR_394091 [Caerostris darwini]|uniref:Uncharacterized protein n=1 Tax=Caerostris darwini TaxID=1538125 RepID=A0AAV4RF74_9ARAC|nr:hypothetical protein CDAR_394091 [Caerostris darwini]